MSAREETKNGASTRGQDYLVAAREQVTLEDWRRIIAQAKEDAITAAAGVRDRARRFLAEYLIGKPGTSERPDEKRADPIDRYANYSDDELRALIRYGERGSIKKRAGPTDKGGPRKSSRR